MQKEHDLAQSIVKSIGLGRFMILGQPLGLVLALNQRGCTVHMMQHDGDQADLAEHGVYDAIIIDSSVVEQAQDQESLLASLYAATSNHLIIIGPDQISSLVGLGNNLSSLAWSNAAFKAGFRRGLAYESVQLYPLLGNPLLMPLTIFEKLPAAAAEKWPLERILQTRSLHMDMSREHGARADAHIVRYALATKWIRPGDVVLDCACGLGYGTATMAAQSPGATFIGVDIDDKAVSYARDNFADRYGIRYERRSGTDLDFLLDHSVDFISSFETIEHIPDDYEAIIKEFARVLKPGGRIIASVPNLWVDETGEDPNPYHFHAFDYEKFRNAMSRHFLIEARYQQEAPGGFKLADSARNLASVGLDADVQDTEWWVIVAAAEPSVDKGLQISMEVSAAGLDHPRNRMHAIQKALTSNMDVCTSEFQAVIANLCDLILAGNDSSMLGDAIGVLQEALQNGHNCREVHLADLHFYAGQLFQAAGDHEQAIQHYQQVNNAQWHLVNAPIVVSSLFWQATHALRQSDMDSAQTLLERATCIADGALGSNQLTSRQKHLLTALCVECDKAKALLPTFDRWPSRFWQGIDTQKFSPSLGNWGKAIAS